MTLNLFLAWSWFAHGQLTQMALAYAISQFAALGKPFVLKRLRQFEAVQSAIESDALGSPGFPPTEKEVDKFLVELENHPPTTVENQVVRLFSALPSWVQEEDIHRGNIPGIGESLEKDSQVRHYMRSYRSTTALEAHQKSRYYIWSHLYWAWCGMRKGVYHDAKWYDFIYDSTMDDFDGGMKHLASALHTIEDSYSPGHTQRTSGVGTITDVYYWPDTMPNHKQLDEPGGEYYNLAKQASGAFILCLLINLDQEESVYVADCGNKMNTYFRAQL